MNGFRGLRELPVSSRQRRRLIALATTVLANAVLLLTLLHGTAVFVHDERTALPAMRLVSLPVPHALPEMARPPVAELRHRRPSHREALIADADAPQPMIPPTETPRLLKSLPPEADADVVDRSALAALCNSRLLDVGLTIPSEGAVEFRLFVEADGHIALGSVTTPSDKPAADRELLRCVETYGNARPAIVDAAPTAAWQRLQWDWSMRHR